MSSNRVDVGNWPTTHWSLVGRAGHGGIEERRLALTSLLKIYIPALRRHLLRRPGIRLQNVDDVLQEFLISKLLEREILQLADQNRGNFRTFLATALDRFLLNWIRSQSAVKRKIYEVISLDDQSPSNADTVFMEDTFDYSWARQVLGRAIRLMRSECQKSQRSDVWGVFKGRVLGPSLRNSAPIPYEKLIDRVALKSGVSGSNVLVTARRGFHRCLCQVLSAYQDRESIENEIRNLWRAVARPRARSKQH